MRTSKVVAGVGALVAAAGWRESLRRSSPRRRCGSSGVVSVVSMIAIHAGVASVAIGDASNAVQLTASSRVEVRCDTPGHVTWSRARIRREDGNAAVLRVVYKTRGDLGPGDTCLTSEQIEGGGLWIGGTPQGLIGPNIYADNDQLEIVTVGNESTPAVVTTAFGGCQLRIPGCTVSSAPNASMYGSHRHGIAGLGSEMGFAVEGGTLRGRRANPESGNECSHIEEAADSEIRWCSEGEFEYHLSASTTMHVAISEIIAGGVYTSDRDTVCVQQPPRALSYVRWTTTLEIRGYATTNPNDSPSYSKEFVFDNEGRLISAGWVRSESSPDGWVRRDIAFTELSLRDVPREQVGVINNHPAYWYDYTDAFVTLRLQNAKEIPGCGSNYPPLAVDDRMAGRNGFPSTIQVSTGQLPRWVFVVRHKGSQGDFDRDFGGGGPPSACVPSNGPCATYGREPDGQIDYKDLLVLMDAVRYPGCPVPQADVDNNPGVDLADVELLLCNALADYNCDGFLDFFDLDGYLAAFESQFGCPSNGELSADIDRDTFVDFFDLDLFFAAFDGPSCSSQAVNPCGELD